MFRTHSLAALLLLSLVSQSGLAQPHSPTAFPAAGEIDLSSGRLCFPLEYSPEAALYDVCLQLRSSADAITFSVASVAERAERLDAMASFSESAGLTIPVVESSIGQRFRDVRFVGGIDGTTGEFMLTLTGGSDVTPLHDGSIARAWNEVLLDAIRHDQARPTVHSRNLFHVSAAMYDAWAAFDTTAEPWLLGKTLNGFSCPFTGISVDGDLGSARQEAISFAAYRMLYYRFANSPRANTILPAITDAMVGHAYNPAFVSTEYSDGSAAALGNHIAQCLISYGQQDGANESSDYASLDYLPVNDSLDLAAGGIAGVVDPNRWQPLAFIQYRDPNGNLIPDSTPAFLSPEWSDVQAFALDEPDMNLHSRDDRDWRVYLDPGPPPLIDDALPGLEVGEYYKWGFRLVSQWSAQLDPGDGVMWDISPASIGNIQSYPASFGEYSSFYNLEEGGDASQGHPINPATGQPYEPQWVPRADYARVLAEFWADGPNSETPPGHWFTILNYVSDHPQFEKRFEGQGEPMDDLEWDIKSYFTLGAAMHDTAVAVWGIKGYYDYVRPITAIRYMASRGQSSDPDAPNYDPEGIPLVPGFIELVEEGDPLLEEGDVSVGDIKLYAWRGPAHVGDPDSETAGVGWIPGTEWWPYQQPTFVTPPFAGYVSGHSAFSRTAARVLTLLTGDEYFPGGMGEFEAPANEYLHYESGPSVDVTLQWATYLDASDQSSLSRIWGGIHPPADDIPGRLIGDQIGPQVFSHARNHFLGTAGQ